MSASQCIWPLSHKWEYHSTMEGKSYWCCWQCGAVTFEMEDAQL